MWWTDDDGRNNNYVDVPTLVKSSFETIFAAGVHRITSEGIMARHADPLSPGVGLKVMHAQTELLRAFAKSKVLGIAHDNVLCVEQLSDHKEIIFDRIFTEEGSHLSIPQERAVWGADYVSKALQRCSTGGVLMVSLASDRGISIFFHFLATLFDNELGEHAPTDVWVFVQSSDTRPSEACPNWDVRAYMEEKRRAVNELLPRGGRRLTAVEYFITLAEQPGSLHPDSWTIVHYTVTAGVTSPTTTAIEGGIQLIPRKRSPDGDEEPLDDSDRAAGPADPKRLRRPESGHNGEGARDTDVTTPPISAHPPDQDRHSSLFLVDSEDESPLPYAPIRSRIDDDIDVQKAGWSSLQSARHGKRKADDQTGDDDETQVNSVE